MTAQSITEVLVAVDGTPRSDDAARIAAVFADRMAVPVSLVRCCRPYLSFVDAQAEAHDLASSLVGVVKRIEVVHSTNIAGDLLTATDDLPGSVLCLASHGRSEVGTAILGSVSREVVDRSPHPVLLVGPHASVPDSFSAVDVAFNSSGLAWVALESISAWARQLGATPWITRVDPVEPPPRPADVAEVGDLQRAADRLEELGLRAEWDVLHGDDPGEAVAAWGQNHGVALYAAGAHSRAGLQELFFGSAANRLVHVAERPVLIAGPASAS